jgi:hypothetical protein
MWTRDTATPRPATAWNSPLRFADVADFLNAVIMNDQALVKSLGMKETVQRVADLSFAAGLNWDT